MIEFKLPSLGADMEQGKLLEWKVKPGDPVKKGDVVAVVDTSKAAIDVEIWQEGTVFRLLAQAGETMPVGAVMALLLAPGEQPATAAPPAAATTLPQRRRVAPAARKRAEELQVNLDAVTGTGPQGAVTVEDVEQAMAAATPAPAPTGDRQTEMRRAIAAAMARSKREIPHYYLSESIPLARAGAWLAAENARRPVTARLLMAALLLKAVALAARQFPEMNGCFQDGAFRPIAAVHLGVAIALRQGGLIAPALHNTADLPLGELMAQLSDLVRRARAGSLRSSELADPTLTVTNLGDQGVESVHGVIYPPQVALVGFGKVALRPWVEDGTLQALPLLTASLSADHRVSDGHRGALFLARIRDLLQQPETL